LFAAFADDIALYFLLADALTQVLSKLTAPNPIKPIFASQKRQSKQKVSKSASKLTRPILIKPILNWPNNLLFFLTKPVKKLIFVR
jgi:hypothetical protein